MLRFATDRLGELSDQMLQRSVKTLRTAEYFSTINWINQDMVNCGQLKYFRNNKWINYDIVYCGQLKYFNINSWIDQAMVYCGQL